MTFKLSEELITDIIFAMENQNSESAVDAENGCVVDVEFELERIEIDEDNFYSLPQWNSSDGYKLMESFVNELRSPVAHADLKRVITGGRGVFRNFKNTLVLYPEVEKKWFAYKDKSMRERVLSWYEDLRESWGLERLPVDENEISETDDLVENDFDFREYDSSADGEEISRQKDELAEECKRQFAHFGDAVAEFCMIHSEYACPEEKFGFVCRAQSGELVGFVLSAPCPHGAKANAVFTDFYVALNYRGLGIGKELLEKCLALLKGRGIEWALALGFTPESTESLLLGFGFEKTGSGFVLDLHKI